MAATYKGKGKARMEPLSSSDEDEDPLAMFEMKTSLRGLGRTDQKRNEIVISDHSVDEEEDENGAKKKTKKKTKKRVPPATLPEWTRSNSNGESHSRRSHKRSSTESRRSGERSELITISSDDEGNSPKRSKGKGKERAVEKTRRALTPPPQLTEAELKAEQAKILAHVQQRTALAPLPKSDDDEPVFTRTTAPSGPTIVIHVNMITDKSKLPEGASEKAIKQWEKKRNINIYKNAKIADLYYGLATNLQRSPEDIVLVFNDRVLNNRQMSAKQLLIADGSYLVGYAKEHWDRIAKEKQDELDLLLYGASARPLTPPPEAASPTSAPVIKTKICLRGEWGATKVAVLREITAYALAELYCEKHQKDLSIARTLKLDFDGTLMGVNATVEDVEMEDGDLVDVRIPDNYK